MTIRTLLSRARIALKIRRAERDIRHTTQQADIHRCRATYYHGEVLPHLSLHLANLRLQQRQLRDPARPLLGQVRPRTKSMAAQ
jgi:hypothetical protein